LSEQEERGLRVFNDPARGNCARCHASGSSGLPQFTDFGFAALGVPRNAAVAGKAGHFDLGLCGPLRSDLAGQRAYCGMFRVPSLRNVATRKRFFHNGSFTSLERVVRFYAERDAFPERFYPRGPGGKPRVFDDLPAQDQANVDREPPFGRKRGDGPALTDAEIADVVAFLGTLTDGYRAPTR
jgi:cytochrome c peroxidase